MTPNLSNNHLTTALLDAISKSAPTLTINTRLYNAIEKAASDVAKQLLIPHKGIEPNMGLDKWLTSDEVNPSSKFMAYTLTSRLDAMCEYAHPNNSIDFKKCEQLLIAEPALREKLPLMSETSKYWASLVSNWKRRNDLIKDGNHQDANALINEFK